MTTGSQRDGLTVGRVLVCMPTYNEIESLPVTAGRLRNLVPDVDLLVIDDGSPDGTGAYADEPGGCSDPSVHVLHRTSKEGLGAAYTAGFGWALEHGYDVVVEMDADGSATPPRRCPDLLAAIEKGADLALGFALGAGWRGRELAEAPRGALPRAATPTSGWLLVCRSVTRRAASAPTVPTC